MTAVTSDLYFPIWLHSMIYKSFYQPLSRLPIQTWMPKGQDPVAQAESACHHQTTASSSQQINLYWNSTWWRVITAETHCAMWMASPHMQSPQRNPAILDLQRRIDHLRWNSTEGNLHYSATQLMSWDNSAPTYWTPWVRKCLNRTKQSMYWPGLYGELKELVTNCNTCLRFSSKKPNCVSKTQHARHEIPVNPWSKLASEFHFEGESYLLIVDYTSRFPIIRKLNLMTGKAIAHHMQAIFAEYRWPDTLVTDNGPCYTSKEFQMLKESMSVNHIASSPQYPPAMGLQRNLRESWKPVLQSQGARSIPIQSINGVQKHTTKWKLTITNANHTRKTSSYWSTLITFSHG